MYIVQGVFILECLYAIKVGTEVSIIKTIYQARRAPLAKWIKGYILIPFLRINTCLKIQVVTHTGALDKSPVQLSLERYWRANSTHPGNHHARQTWLGQAAQDQHWYNASLTNISSYTYRLRVLGRSEELVVDLLQTSGDTDREAEGSDDDND